MLGLLLEQNEAKVNFGSPEPTKEKSKKGGPGKLAEKVKDIWGSLF